MRGPSDWSRPLDVSRLAEANAEIDFIVPLVELAHLRSARAPAAGSVRGRVHFAREANVAMAVLGFTGTATLQCQRCMGPMELPLDASVEVGFIGAEAQMSAVPGNLEPVLAAGGRISIGELLTEELLLMLPTVPLHADGLCVAPGAAPPADASTHRPFAGLAELLKR